MIIILFLEGLQLAETKNKFYEFNLFKKRKVLINKRKILIILQKLRNK